MRKSFFQLLSIALLTSLFSFVSAQKVYKEMMNDNSINFYDVCEAAESYFETQDPNVKGSGWKGYARWRQANEYKYYPSGDRSQIDPFFAAHAFQDFVKNNPANSGMRLFNNGWEGLGPYTIDSITGHYAAGLGRVEDLYVDPSDTNRIYLGSRSGGFWRTLDGGATWSGGATDFLFASGVNTIGVSPTNSDSILINVRNARNGYSHGVYRSVNGGTSFVQSNFNPTNVGFGGLGDNFAIYRIAYHPTIPNLVFIGTNEGLYRSDNNLSTWVRMLNPGQINRIQFHPTNPNIVYAYDNRTANRDYVYRSTNAGVSFTQSSAVPGNSGSSGRLSVSNGCTSCLYFASGNGIWKSTDEGQNFAFIASHSGGNGGFTVNDQDTSKMLNGYVDIVTSADGGQNFNQVTWWYLGNSNHGVGSLQDRFNNTTKYAHADLRVARSLNGVYYVGTDGYICKSGDNGANWTVLSEGTSIRENYNLGISQSDHYRVVCGSQDNGTSLHTKGGWVEYYGADGMEAIVHPLNYDWFIGSFQYGGRRGSKNGGLTSSNFAPAGQTGSGNADWIAPLAYDPNDHMRIYHFSQSVWRSDNFGTNWVQLGSPNSFSGNIQKAAIAENNSDIIVMSRGSSIDKSVDGGVTFASIKNNLPNSSIKDIAFDPLDDNVIAVTYASYQNNNQKVYLTTNGGGTWTNITYNLGNMPLQSVVIDHSDASNIYVGAEIGVYVKPMTGTTWTLYNSNLPNTSVLEMEINYGSNTLKAATWGRGLWEYNLKDRADYPAILNTTIDNLPTETAPVEGSYQFVTSVISYANTLDSVYVEWSANAPTFGNVIPMENTVDSTWRSETALPIFPVGTKLYFKVFAIGTSSDTTETYKFMYTVKPYSLCNASGSSGTGSDYIDYVELNGVSNATGQNYYSNYSNIFIDLDKDSTYTLQVGLNFAFGPDTCRGWIDYDRDGTFEASEAINMSAFNGSSQAFGTFTVPSSAVVGDTLVLRIRNAYNTAPIPCGTVAGEVEDYRVVIKDGACINSTSSISPMICGTVYTAPDGATYSTSGTYAATIPNMAGCDSTITINLTMASNTSSTLNPSTCGASYTAPDGAIYTTTGTYSATIPNAAGCDSIITINLAVNGATSSTINPNTCGAPYTAPDGMVYASTGTYSATIPNAAGCDSIITINLSVNSGSGSTINPISCTSTYTAPDGAVYTSNGSYSATIPNAVGCDSVITINLVFSTFNTGVSSNGDSLNAIGTGLAYQWLDCDSGFVAIPNATNQYFVPTTSGNYAVQLSDGTCQDTSACTNVVIVGLDLGRELEAYLFPNPTNSVFQVQFGSEMQAVRVRVTDVSGKVLLEKDATNTDKVQLELEAASGMYFVEVVADGLSKVFKLRKDQ